MKKRICAMALTLALAAGGLSLASDLNYCWFNWSIYWGFCVYNLYSSNYC